MIKVHKIKQAIIPVAGLATHTYPMNKVTKKSLLPICDIDGRVKPVILKLLEELDQAGIEKIYLIIGKEDRELYESLFELSPMNVYKELSERDKKYDKRINKIGKKVSYIIQDKPLGFGAAVYLAKPKLKNKPVLLLLGDTIYKTNESRNSVEQLLDYYDEIESSIVSLKELDEKELKNYSVVYGNWENSSETQMLLKRVIEKPSVKYAKKNLLINNKYYGNFGALILTNDIFIEFEKIMSNPIESGKEYQLMDAFDNLAQKKSVYGIVINGNSYDMGNIESYIEILRKY